MSTPSPAPSDRALYLRLLGYVRPYWHILVLSLLAMIIQAAMEPAKAALLRPMLDQLFVNRDPGMLLVVPGLIILVFTVSGLGSFGGNAAINWIANRVVADLRIEMFSRLLEFPSSYYDRYSSGGLISRFTFDVIQIKEAASNTLTIVVKDSLMIIGLLAWMVYMNWRLSGIALIATPFVVVIVLVIRHRLRRMSRRVQDTMVDINHSLGEVVEGHRIVKLFGGHAQERDRFRRIISANLKYSMKFIYASAASGPAVQLVAAISLSIIVYVAANQAFSEQLSVGEFGSFFAAMAMLMDPLKRLVRINEHVQRGLAACESVFGLLDAEPEPDHGAIALPHARGEIEIRNLHYCYQGENEQVLKSINLHIKPGEMVALVGASGSGKTTLVHLIARFYGNEPGRVFLDGHDIMDIRLADLRANLALVSQDIVLFDDSVRNNIAYGDCNTASDAEVEAAAAAAHALEFIRELPEGFATTIGSRGSRLSGGQRQRIALARALLRAAPILILDEATSALDRESEHQIQLALEEIRSARTCIIIAHRLSTIETADRVIVLHKGRIVETGTHQELLQRNGTYASYYPAARRP